MKVYLTTSIWRELLFGKAYDSLLAELESRIQKNQTFFTSDLSLLELWKSFSWQGKENQILHLIQESVSEILRSPASILYQADSSERSGEGSTIALEVLVALENGIEEILVFGEEVPTPMRGKLRVLDLHPKGNRNRLRK